MTERDQFALTRGGCEPALGWERAAEACASPDMRAHRSNQSSMIDRICFDDDTGILCVSFRETGKYLYYDVPAAIFEAFCKAPSAGAFFNERLKNRFHCRRDPERRRFGPSA